MPCRSRGGRSPTGWTLTPVAGALEEFDPHLQGCYPPKGPADHSDERPAEPFGVEWFAQRCVEESLSLPSALFDLRLHPLLKLGGVLDLTGSKRT